MTACVCSIALQAHLAPHRYVACAPLFCAGCCTLLYACAAQFPHPCSCASSQSQQSLLICTSSTCRMRGPNNQSTRPQLYTHIPAHTQQSMGIYCPLCQQAHLLVEQQAHQSLRYQSINPDRGICAYIHTHTFKRLPPKASHQAPASLPRRPRLPRNVVCESQQQQQELPDSQQELPDSRQDVLPQQQLVCVQGCAHMKKWGWRHITDYRPVKQCTTD